MDLKAVLFDFDGTLQQGDKVDVTSRLWDLVCELKMNVRDAELVKIVSSRSDFREMIQDLVSLDVKRGGNSESNAAIDYHKLNISGRYDDKIRLFPDTLEVLDDLKAAGYVLGLVTTRGGNSLPRLLERHSLTEYFDGVIVNRDKCKERKPNPEPLLKGLELAAVSPNQAIYVGDNQVDDIGAARNAGVFSVLLGDESYAEGLPKPHYSVQTLSEFSTLLREL